MTGLALRGLAARPLRTALTALAVVLGVALVSASLTLGDTLRKGADALSASAYDGTDAVVTARTTFAPSMADGQQAPPLPAATVAQAAAVDGAGLALGDIVDSARIVVDGEPVGQGPYFAEGIDAATPGAEALTPFRLRDGAWASGPDEVVVDAGTAAREDLAVGDAVQIATRGPARELTISGIARFGGVDTIGQGSAVVFDLATAQALFDKAGKVDHVLVAGAEGTDPAQLRAALADALPSDTVTTAAANDRFQLAELSTVVDVVSAVLLGFGIVAVLVAAFTILNSLSITVAQRTRELALLRMVGGDRGQVRRMVLAEALALGVGASVLGAGLGILLGAGLRVLLDAVSLDLPYAGLVVAPSSIAIALLVGTLATLLAAVVPARRATRVQPVEALAAVSGAQLRRPGLAGRAFGGVVSALGRPAERLGGTAGRLARRNAMRNPGRTAVTATALAIGVALVTLVSVVAAGLKDTTVSSLEQRLQGSHVVIGADGWSPIDGEVGRRLAGAPGVEAVTSFRQDGVLAHGSRERINGIDPATAAPLFDFDWVEGSHDTLAGLADGDAIVDEGYAKEHGLAIGDTFTVTAAGGTETTLTVAGVERSPVLDMLYLGPITVTASTFDDGGFSARRDTLTLVEAADAAAVDRVLADFPDAAATPTAEWIAEQAGAFDAVVALFAVLLGLCVIVSLFGIVNALVLAGFERTRELGTLRALGMSRRQMRRMVRHESIVTALLGAVLGVVGGLALAAIVTAAFASEGLAFTVPVAAMVAFGVLAVVAGVLAAALPARRAARLDVLGALAWE